MKKSFMTRALATGLSLAMAFSLSAATNVTVASAASTPTMASKQFAVRVGGATKTYKASAATLKTYRITKATVGNSSKATVAVASSKKGIKVTPGTVTGSTVVKVTFKNSKTKKSTARKFRCVVKPAQENPKPPVEEKPTLSEVSQAASNAINVSFTTDASKTVTKDNMTIKSTDGSVELAINTIEFSADGKSARVTVFGNFTNATQYNVSYDSTDKTFTASVGSVASVTVETASAEKNVETPIKFTLKDAQGIDVTPATNLDAHVTVDVTGSYYTLENSLASKAKITMNNVGDVADVTVTYSPNQAGEENVVGTGKITCVSATAKVGNTMFVSTTNTNLKSGCAKFYQGLKDERVTVAVNEENDDVYFCATDNSGDVISYDSYAVESANDNIATAVTMQGQATGKYVRILVGGSNVGNTQLNITATKNGVDSHYTIPVTVTKTDAAVKMDVTQDRTEMSTVDETGYDCTVTAALFDTNNKKVLSSFDCELITEIPQGATKPVISAPSSWDNTEASFDITFANAYAKEDTWTTYTFRITGVDENHKDTKFTKNVTVRVKKLPANLTNDLDYQIELTVNGKVSNAVEETKTAEREITAKLYANYNSLFAGYVKAKSVSGSAAATAAGITNGAIAGGAIPTQSAITAISGCALRGVDIYAATSASLTGNLMQRATGGTKQGYSVAAGENASGQNFCSMTFESVRDLNSDSNIDTSNEAAEVGSYDIAFTYALANGKTVTKNSGFKVTRDYKTPTAKVSTTTVNRVDSAYFSDDFDNIIKTAITTNVDMNNNNSGYASITMGGQGLYKKATTKSGATNLVDLYEKLDASDIHNNRIVVGYVQVVDNIGSENWLFYAPVNATFKQI